MLGRQPAGRAGADVVVAEKGYCGTSGVTPTAGPGHWWVPPDAALRAAAVARRVDSGLGLADPSWMQRVLDTTWRTLPSIAPHYAFSRDDSGATRYRDFACELYCQADAIYVGPAVEAQSGVAPQAVRERLGQFRRWSGWHEFASDPRYSNDHWRMEEVFIRARG
jgi:hypothetical protein